MDAVDGCEIQGGSYHVYQTVKDPCRNGKEIVL